MRLIVPFVIFFSLFFFYLRYFPTLPITYWDEYLWLGETPFFHLFISGDFSNPLWQSFYSYNQPKLALYAFGLAIYPDYLHTKGSRKDYSMTEYIFDRRFYRLQDGSNAIRGVGLMNPSLFNGSPNDLRGTYGDGILPTIRLIFLARTLNALLLALALVAAYFLVLTFSKALVAVAVSFLYGFNSLIIYAGLKAHSEALFLLLFNVGLLILVRLVKSKNMSYKALFLFAGVSALCAQTKLNGIMLLFFFVFFLGIKLLKAVGAKNWEASKQYGARILFVGYVWFALFVALHPFLYQRPFSNTIFLYKHRFTVATEQAEKGKELSLASPYQRIAAMYSVFFSEKPFTSASLLYSRDSLNPLRNSFNSLIFIGRLPRIVLLLLLLCFALGVWRTPRVLLTVFLLMQISMAFYLLWSGYRYYVPLVFFMVFIEVIGFLQLLRGVQFVSSSLVLLSKYGSKQS